MEIVKETVIERDKNAMAANLDDEIIMMDSESGNYFKLNSTAILIWEMLERGSLTFDQICQALVLEFDIDYKTCSKDTKKFLLDMFRKNVILISHH